MKKRSKINMLKAVSNDGPGSTRLDRTCGSVGGDVVVNSFDLVDGEVEG